MFRPQSYRDFERCRRAWIRALNEYLRTADFHTMVEAAAPSYAHRRGMISWFFWQRIYYVVHYLERLPEVGKALDFGCGLGILLPHLQRLSDDVSGVDVFIDPARSLQDQMDFQNVKLFESLDQCLEANERLFDTVTALDVLEHMDDLAGTFRKLFDHMSEHGRLIICGPTESFIYRLGRFLAGFHKIYEDFEHASESSNPHHHRTIDDIERIARELGYRVEPIKTLYPVSPLFKIFAVHRPGTSRR